MQIIQFIWDYVIVFVFVLTVLVFVHEMGHYLVARRCGVRVEVFSIGFGPEIYGWTNRLGTRWKISLIPLGGYVKMFGEYDVEGEESPKMTAEEEAVSFHHKTVLQRTAIVTAGPLANFAFAMVLLAGLFGIVGSPTPLAGVGTVQPGSAAEEAGLRPGDKVLRIAGEPVKWFDDMRRIISANGGARLEIVVRRGGEELSLMATPKWHEVTDREGRKKKIGLLGVSPDPKQVAYVRYDPLTAAWMGVARTAAMTGQILGYLGDMITGSRTADELGGPLRIAQFSGQMAQGGPISLIFFMAALSINLGLINLFPIPMLDGGHLVFYAAEAVRGRPLGPRFQEYGFRFGLILVLAIMIYATWNDLEKLKVIEFIRQLVT